MGLSISTVIPTYNVGEHLSQAIGSVLEQSRPSDEIIIVDDCSTDDTLAVARSFADPRIQVLSTACNSGSPTARNIGIRAATGDLIAMLDGDDYWLPNHLSRVAGLLDQHDKASLAFSPTEAFGAESWIWPVRISINQPVNCFWDCLPRTIVPHMSVVVRRQALLDTGCYDQSFRQAQDYDLFLRLSHRFAFVCTDEITSRYRRHPGSITVRRPKNSMHCMYRARFEFGRTLVLSASPAEAEKYVAACLDLWESALNICVAKRDWDLMDFHLSQARYVEGSDASLLKWRLRRAAGTMQKIWDYASRPVRNPFRTGESAAA